MTSILTFLDRTCTTPCFKSYVNLHAHWPIPWNQPLPYIKGLLFMDFDNVTLTSQKPCLHNNKLIYSEINGCNIPQYTSLKRRCYSDIFLKKINFIYPADKTFRIIRIIDFNRAEPTCYRTNFHCAISGEFFDTNYYA